MAIVKSVRARGRRSRGQRRKDEEVAKATAGAAQPQPRHREWPWPRERRSQASPPPRPGRGVFSAALNFLGCVLFLFLLLVTLETLLQSLVSSSGWRSWRSAPTFFFFLGTLVLPVFVWGLREWMLYFYVFGHELTHVVFIYLCGGRVRGPIRVSLRGGHVVTNKTNLLISLSPYCVPFYSILVTTCFALASIFVDLHEVHFARVLSHTVSFEFMYLMYALVGFTWAMHLYYTVIMIGKDQPDLRMNGRLLSLLFIVLVNAAIVSAFVIVASSHLKFGDYGELWQENMNAWLQWAIHGIAELIW